MDKMDTQAKEKLALAEAKYQKLITILRAMHQVPLRKSGKLDALEKELPELAKQYRSITEQKANCSAEKDKKEN